MNISGYESDLFPAGENISITYLGHGTLYINCGGREIHIDPADYE